jgi:MFS family permease
LSATGPFPWRLPTPGPASTVLAAAVTVQVAVSVLEQGVPTLAFAFQRDLRLSATEVGLLVSLFNLGRMVGSIPWGRAVDSQGTRRVLVLGGGGLALFATVTSLSPDPLIGPCLFVAGLFAASVSPAGIRLLMSHFEPARHSVVLGLRQTAIPVGGALAAFTLPALALAVDWRFAIAMAGLGVLIASIPVICVAPARASVARDRPRQARRWRQDLERFSAAGAARVTGWGMVLVAAQYGVVTYGIILLEDRFGMRAATAALLVGGTQLAGASGRVGWVMLGNRVFEGRPEKTMCALTLVGALGIAILVALPSSASAVAITGAFLLTGVAVTGWPGLYVSFISTRAHTDHVGATVGLGLTFINLAALTGPPVLGLLVDHAGGHRAAWGTLAAALLLSLLTLRRVGAASRGAAREVH